MNFPRRALFLNLSSNKQPPIFKVAILPFLLWFMISAAHCQPSRSRITSLIQDLRSSRAEVRDSASTRLMKLAESGLTREELIEALEAAAGASSSQQASKDDIGQTLVLAVAQHPTSECAPVVRRLIEKYSPGARDAALMLLGKLQDPTSVAITVDLIVELDSAINAHGSDTTQPEADAMIEPITYGVLLDHLQTKRISAAQLSRLEPVIIAASQRHASIVAPLQRAAGTDWIWEESYIDHRDNAAYLLDILGYFPSQKARHELSVSLPYTDPYLKYFTVTSLLRHGVTVSADEFNQVARDSYMRISLFSTLERMKRLDLFPQKYKTQPALAESDMVRWLVYPTELGRAPDSIEQMAIRSVKTAEGIEDYYFFRFRTNPPHWAADKGWMAGISGPFLRASTPTADGGGYTFSEFKPWTDSFPDEYMRANKE